jgi:cytochrome c oxidase subunit 3
MEETILLPQFDDLQQQQDTSNLGMWFFLASEVLFFGSLIVAYAVYRITSPIEFALASQHLKLWMGCVNTIVLLGSSLTMAMAVRSAQLHRRRHLLWFLGFTMVLGTCFLGIKAGEYALEYREHLVPGPGFRVPDRPAAVSASPSFNANRFQMFFVFYFFMTGLHAVHLVIGVCIVGVIACLSWRRWFSGSGETQIEATGLYWHFVDVVWVFLYPLLYLIDVPS